MVRTINDLIIDIDVRIVFRASLLAANRRCKILRGGIAPKVKRTMPYKRIRFLRSAIAGRYQMAITKELS